MDHLGLPDLPQWRQTVRVAEVTLRLARPIGINGGALRGVVVQSLFPDPAKARGMDVDWHQHVTDDETRFGPPPILYRMRSGVPTVFMWGPFAHHHASRLRSLRVLRAREGDVEVLGADVHAGTVDVLLDSFRRYIYRLATPYFPGEPRPEGLSGRRDWARRLLGGSIGHLLRHMGIPGPRRPWVDIVDFADARVNWRGRHRWGFQATLTTDARLPDGIGLGRHRSEGWGEIRLVSMEKRQTKKSKEAADV